MAESKHHAEINDCLRAVITNCRETSILNKLLKIFPIKKQEIHFYLKNITNTGSPSCFNQAS